MHLRSENKDSGMKSLDSIVYDPDEGKQATLMDSLPDTTFDTEQHVIDKITHISTLKVFNVDIQNNN
jgi:hypothetical protein